MPIKVAWVVLVLSLSIGLVGAGCATTAGADSIGVAAGNEAVHHEAIPQEMKETVTPDTPANRALLKAVQTNDLKAVEAAFAAGAEPNIQLVYVSPLDAKPSHPIPLLSLVGLQHPDPSHYPTAIAIFRQFLAHKVDIKATSEDGRNAVFWALGLEDAALLREVLDAGGDPNAMYKSPFGGGNAVHAASAFIIRGKEEKTLPLVQLVLERGGDPNVFDPRGMTPLHMQALYGNPGCVALLLKHKADPSLKSKAPAKSQSFHSLPGGWTALQFARRGGDERVINLLLAARKEKNAGLSVTEAATVGDVNALQQHLKTGMNPRGKDEDGTPFILLAAASGKEDAVRLLLDRGADPNMVGPYQSTALIRASILGYTSIVRLLLARNANPNWVRIRNPNSPQPETALTEAIRAAEPEVVALLVASKRLDWNAPGNRDALISAIDNAGRTPLHPISKDRNQRKRGEGLLSAQGEIYESIVARINLQKFGGAALATAAARGQFGMAQDLLQRGVPLNGRDREGKTVLLATVESLGLNRYELDPEMLKVEHLSADVLQERRVAVAAQDKEGMAFLRALLTRRPDVSATRPTMDPKRDAPTALASAQLWRMPDVERLLRKAGAKK